eukprot:9186380-Prorocentrum_lima.AAC.1
MHGRISFQSAAMRETEHCAACKLQPKQQHQQQQQQKQQRLTKNVAAPVHDGGCKADCKLHARQHHQQQPQQQRKKRQSDLARA